MMLCIFSQTEAEIDDTCTHFALYFPEADDLAVVISLSIMIVVTLLVGFLSGLLVMWCWFKKSSLKTSTEETQYNAPPNPVYDEVSHDRGVSVQLTTNEAYGHM
jgi:flagellar basal body-associated protein FliL